MMEYISVKEAARMMGCSPAWINKLINRGSLQAYIRGSRRRRELKKTDVMKYISTLEPIKVGERHS